MSVIFARLGTYAGADAARVAERGGRRSVERKETPISVPRVVKAKSSRHVRGGQVAGGMRTQCPYTYFVQCSLCYLHTINIYHPRVPGEYLTVAEHTVRTKVRCVSSSSRILSTAAPKKQAEKRVFKSIRRHYLRVPPTCKTPRRQVLAPPRHAPMPTPLVRGSNAASRATAIASTPDQAALARPLQAHCRTLTRDMALSMAAAGMQHRAPSSPSA